MARWDNSRSGKTKGYENLYDATRLGEVDGLCGANCRHNYYGYYEGSTRTWSKEELENIDPEPFEYNGREYTFYEATQRMRYMERQIRKTKREAVGFEAAGLDEDFTSASIKLNRQKQEYQKFARASGVRPRLERTQEFGYNHSVSSRAVWRNRKHFTKEWNSEYNKITAKTKMNLQFFSSSNKKNVLQKIQNGDIDQQTFDECYEYFKDRFKNGIKTPISTVHDSKDRFYHIVDRHDYMMSKGSIDRIVNVLEKPESIYKTKDKLGIESFCYIEDGVNPLLVIERNGIITAYRPTASYLQNTIKGKGVKIWQSN